MLLKHQGEHYHLKEIYDQLNEKYFDNKLDLPITWFGNKFIIPRRVVRLGSYHQHTQMIKIHRLLDQAHVPHHMVAFIVYHEMLHHVLPPIVGRGKRKIHHKAFNEREKQFEEYALAKEFSANLRKTLFKR